MGRIKPVKRKYAFACRENPIRARLLNFWDYRYCDAENNLKNSQVIFLSSVHSFTENLMKEIKLVVNEYEYEARDE